MAINDLGNPKTNAHLFKYDSTYGKFKKEVIIEEGNLVINGKTIRFEYNIRLFSR